MKRRAGVDLDTIAWWAWLALLVAVPVTSFPPVEATIGGDTVSPLSLIPLLLLGVWLLRYVVRGGRLPAESRPLLAFGLLAAVGSVASLLLPLAPYKGQTVLTRGVHGLATLFIGLSFYSCAAVFPRDPRRMRSSLLAINLGGAVTLLWSSLQAPFVLSGVPRMPWQLNEIHRFFSIRDLFTNRVTGLAYEPSWLGNQLVVLYLPLWLGCLVTGYSAARKAGKIPVLELGLSIWGASVLLLAESRISVAGFLIASGMLCVGLLWRVAGKLARQSPAGVQTATRSSGILPRVAVLGLGLVAFAVLVGVVLRISSTTDWRIRRILALPEELAALRAEYPFEFGYAVADRAAFAERVVYWRAGFSAFERYPLLGVGLGNAGFLFADGIPAYGYRLVEIRQALEADNATFPNPKSLWIRLLAETGFIGTAVFLSWMVLMLADAVSLARAPDRQLKAIGMAGILALPAWLLEGFSLDTFALPQIWVLLGLVTAAAWRVRRQAEAAAGSISSALAASPVA